MKKRKETAAKHPSQHYTPAWPPAKRGFLRSKAHTIYSAKKIDYAWLLMNDTAAMISATQQWVDRVVVGLNLCPFAATPLSQDRVRFVLSRAPSLEALLHELVDEALQLDQPDTTADTTLLIVPSLLADFDNFLDAVATANALLEDTNLEQQIQLAHFHPDYVFAGTTADDASNLTNRSPYPMLHLLRVADVRAAIDTYPNVRAIPRENQERLRTLGTEAVRKIMIGTLIPTGHQ
jgi:hypothetical protein